MKRSRTTPENGNRSSAFFAKVENGQRLVAVERLNCLLIRWTRTGVGLGEIVLKLRPGGLHIDAETMDAAFVKDILGALIDEAYADGRVK